MENRTPNTSMRKRAGAICVVLSLLFIALAIRILFYQTFKYDEYNQKVLDQITRETKVSANRGSIYDTNGIVIATNITTYRLFIDPATIARQSEKDGVNYAEIIANGISAIDTLGVSYDDVMKQMSYTRYRDRTLARHISEEQAEAVRSIILPRQKQSSQAIRIL